MCMCVGWLTLGCAKYTDLAYEKGTKLIEAGYVFSKFRTRHRHLYRTQDLVVSQLAHTVKAHLGKGRVLGMSNIGSTLGF